MHYSVKLKRSRSELIARPRRRPAVPNNIIQMETIQAVVLAPLKRLITITASPPKKNKKSFNLSTQNLPGRQLLLKTKSTQRRSGELKDDGHVPTRAYLGWATRQRNSEAKNQQDTGSCLPASPRSQQNRFGPGQLLGPPVERFE